MRKILILFSLCFIIVFAKIDFSEMSTQELIAIMGYVEKENQKDFNKELKSRVSTMSNSEKREYNKNLKFEELQGSVNSEFEKENNNFEQKMDSFEELENELKKGFKN